MVHPTQRAAVFPLAGMIALLMAAGFLCDYGFVGATVACVTCAFLLAPVVIELWTYGT